MFMKERSKKEGFFELQPASYREPKQELLLTGINGLVLVISVFA